MARAADEGECTINTRSTDRVFVFEVLGRIGRYVFVPRHCEEASQADEAIQKEIASAFQASQ